VVCMDAVCPACRSCASNLCHNGSGGNHEYPPSKKSSFRIRRGRRRSGVVELTTMRPALRKDRLVLPVIHSKLPTKYLPVNRERLMCFCILLDAMALNVAVAVLFMAMRLEL
jgi:hypothetical protein